MILSENDPRGGRANISKVIQWKDGDFTYQGKIGSDGRYVWPIAGYRTWLASDGTRVNPRPLMVLRQFDPKAGKNKARAIIEWKDEDFTYQGMIGDDGYHVWPIEGYTYPWGKHASTDDPRKRIPLRVLDANDPKPKKGEVFSWKNSYDMTVKGRVGEDGKSVYPIPDFEYTDVKLVGHGITGIHMAFSKDAIGPTGTHPVWTPETMVYTGKTPKFQAWQNHDNSLHLKVDENLGELMFRLMDQHECRDPVPGKSECREDKASQGIYASLRRVGDNGDMSALLRRVDDDDGGHDVDNSPDRLVPGSTTAKKLYKSRSQVHVLVESRTKAQANDPKAPIELDPFATPGVVPKANGSVNSGAVVPADHTPEQAPTNPDGTVGMPATSTSALNPLLKQ